MKWGFLTAVLAAALVASGCSATVPADVGRDVAAESVVRTLAAQGDAEAQVTLGWMYETGRAVAKDAGIAARWYRKAADQDNALAQYYLAELFTRGDGVRTDPVEAAAWYRKAAETGNPLAQLKLGRMYESGVGVARDYAAAAAWYARARENWSDLTGLPPGTGRIASAPPLPPLQLTPTTGADRTGGPAADAGGETSPAGSIDAAMAQWKAQQESADASDAARGDAVRGDAARGDGGGGLWIHLASFRAERRARAYRDEVRNRHNDLLGALQIGLARVDLGADKGVWIRVRAGPVTDRETAAVLCRGLRARDLYCAALAP